MYHFRKGLSKEFVYKLKEEYSKKGLWHDIVNDPDLFVGIRDNYLNVYYMGNSLLKIHLEDSQLRSYTHYKYLLKNSLNNPYVGFGFSGEVDFSDRSFMNNTPSIASLKRSSLPYAGLEKKGVHDIVKANINVIDVEVALTQEAEDREKDDMGIPEKEEPTAPRIDFAAFREKSDKSIELQFFEAKHFSYGKVLRVSKGDPKVIKQINSYQVLIKKFQNEIISSYETVCCNLAEILPENRVSDRAKSIASGAEFSVSDQPSLVIFGFDEDQRQGKMWGPHFKKLNELLPGRVLAKGNSRDFVNGIG